MEMEILKKQNGRYCLLDAEGETIGSPLTGKDFAAIERVHGNSNYYRLWKNELCFYLLYANDTETNFIGGSFPQCFKDIKHYSEVTGSFAVYRSDTDSVYLLYEDSSQISDVFLEIGEECDDEHRSRPVKYILNGERWCFFYSKERKFAWRKEKGYCLPKEMSLHKNFPNSYYSVLGEDGYSELAFYDANAIKGDKNGKYHYFKWFTNPNYRFVSIERSGAYLLCESVGHFYYVFNTNSHERSPLCSSIAKPIIGKGYMIISDGDHQQIFINKSIIENHRWRENCPLIVKNDYVFCQNGENDTWRIYRLKNGDNVYTGWKNIQLEKLNNGEIKLWVDTNDVLHLERSLDDIIPACQKWLNEMRRKLPQRAQTPTLLTPRGDQTTSLRPSEAKTDTLVEKEVQSTSPSAVISDNLPDHIDFIVAQKNVKTVNNAGTFIFSNRQHKQFQINDIILWYDISSCRLYVTKYRRVRTYQVLFTKESVNSPYLAENISTRFTRVDMKGISEENLIDKLLSLFGDNIPDEATLKKQKINIFLSGMGFDDLQIRSAIQALYPQTETKEVQVQQTPNQISFMFKDQSYSLGINDIWPVDNPFYRQKFLPKKDYIAILADDNFNEKSSNEDADYDLIGQGNDSRFDQGFGSPANKDIKDGIKRIFLFKNIDGCTIFFDEVKYIDHSFVPEDEFDAKSRKLLKFNLRSLIRKA